MYTQKYVFDYLFDSDHLYWKTTYLWRPYFVWFGCYYLLITCCYDLHSAFCVVYYYLIENTYEHECALQCVDTMTLKIKLPGMFWYVMYVFSTKCHRSSTCNDNNELIIFAAASRPSRRSSDATTSSLRPSTSSETVSSPSVLQRTRSWSKLLWVTWTDAGRTSRIRPLTDR